ncbi:YpsA SLOG family protein [Campylobacter sp. MOP51]|uniref:YpsA SLOG family protein n=1 Tax=Campylobacter canis TaxID=3378588 RepID=UPI003C642373
MIVFKEDKSGSYSARTKANVLAADVTIIFAVNFDSAGTKLTKKLALEADKSILEINVKDQYYVDSISSAIINFLRITHASSVNIAGNGMKTLSLYCTQDQLDSYIYRIFKRVVDEFPIESMRSGGQTGADEAGAKAGLKLGIPTKILAPRGWKFRDATGRDIVNEKEFKARFGAFGI